MYKCSFNNKRWGKKMTVGIEMEDELLVDEEIDDEEAFVTYDIASYPSDLTLAGI